MAKTPALSIQHCKTPFISVFQIPFTTVVKKFVSCRYFNEFLMAHHRQVAREIRDEYIDTMSKIYFSYFKTYISKILKLQVRISSLSHSLLTRSIQFGIERLVLTTTRLLVCFFRLQIKARFQLQIYIFELGLCAYAQSRELVQLYSTQFGAL